MNNRIIYTFILLVYLNLNWVCLNAQINLNCNQLMGIEKMDLLGGLNQLQPEAYKAFKKMKKAALKDGINIQLVSGYRSFNRQLVIWNTKFQRSLDKGRDSLSAFKQNLKYSAIPGTSRHHWGTEIDIVDANGKILKPSLQVKNYETNGVYNKLKIWMNANSERYGFYLVYTNNVNRTGFNYEPWHYTYHQISKKYLNYFINHCLFNLKQNKIFGNQYLKPQFLKKYSQKYLKGINNKLK